MSTLVAYIARSPHGDRLVQVRLTGREGTWSWEPQAATGDRRGEPSGPEGEAVRDVQDAAEWLARMVRRVGESATRLGVLCVDTAGAVCQWVTAPGRDATVVAAALAQDERAWPNSPVDLVPIGAASLQALVDGPAVRGRRVAAGGAPPAEKLAVLAIPDAPVRVLLDALDARGIEVERVVSLWHALALAWDPGGPAAAWSRTGVAGEHVPEPGHDGSRSHSTSARTRPGPVVADSQAPTGIVLIDPAGQLVWCWSCVGGVLAGGRLRLATERRETESARRLGDETRSSPAQPGPPTGIRARVTAADVGRLAAEWLAWSIQLGQAPSRLLCLVPELGGTGPPAAGEQAGTASEQRSGEAEALSPGTLGAMLGRLWPGATVDMVVQDDPVEATLARLARLPAQALVGQVVGPARELAQLTRRPGRVHRAWYRWAAATLWALAVGVTAVGGRAWSGARHARAAADQARHELHQIVQRVAAPGDSVQAELARDAPRLYLEQQLARKRLALDPTGGLEPAKPILAELETLSWVLGTPQVRVESLQLHSTMVHMLVSVPDTATYELVMAGLEGIADPPSNVEWRGVPSTPRNGRQMYVLEGRWKRGAGTGGVTR